MARANSLSVPSVRQVTPSAHREPFDLVEHRPRVASKDRGAAAAGDDDKIGGRSARIDLTCIGEVWVRRTTSSGPGGGHPR